MIDIHPSFKHWPMYTGKKPPSNLYTVCRSHGLVCMYIAKKEEIEKC